MIYSKYLSNNIKNTTLLDKYANFFLQPIKGLLKIKTRTFEIKPNELLEIKNNNTSNKIIALALAILFFIPITICGIILKVVALSNKNLKNKYQKLFKSVEFLLNEPKVKSLLPKIIDEIVLNNIYPFLSPSELSQMELVSKSHWFAINSKSSDIASKCKGHMKGFGEYLPKSIHELTKTYQKLAEKYKYTKELTDLCGGIGNFMQLPVYEVKEGTGHEAMEAFAHSDKFREIPSIFRLRLHWYNEVKEILIIKYSLFIPKEQFKYTCESNDCFSGFQEWIKLGRPTNWQEKLETVSEVWQDYLYIDSKKIGQPMYRNDLPDDLRSSKKYPEFPYQHTLSDLLPYELENGKEKLKKLINNKPISLGFRYVSAPPYIYESLNRGMLYLGRLFKGLPFVLGHVNSKYFYKKIFKKKIFTDFIVDLNGHVTQTEKIKDSGGNQEHFYFD